MAKTVTGLFDNHGAAQSVVRELLAAGFRQDDISIMAAKEAEPQAGGAAVEYVEESGEEQVEDMAKGAGAGAAIGGLAGLVAGLASLAIPGFGPIIAAGPIAAFIAGTGIGATIGGLISGLTRLGVPEKEAQHYAEGVRRGGMLVNVTAPDELAARAVEIMKRHNPVEINKRAAQWREEGWQGFDTKATSTAFSAFVGDGNKRAGVASDDVTSEHERIPIESLNAGPGEIALPVVEERLEVDKRERDRGGVRVESHVTETPVEQDVQLREEHINVQRRPVDYTFHGTEGEAFKEAMVEIREAYEELIVNKKSRVVEEVVIGKEVEERTETVRETLRRTDVEVQPIEPERAKGATPDGSQEGPNKAR
ncbi:MAG TPA: YsnF/AvaK domain-containing protein [Pyrinomonadaceae bacterium]